MIHTPENEPVCKNCGNHFTGSYCNECGQKAAHRLDVPYILHESVHVFTHTDKGIFKLIPEVLFRPGLLALNYVNGRRKRYFSIFQYLIIIVGLNTFLIAKTGMMDTMMGTFSDADQSARITTVQTKVGAFMKEYLNLVMFALIPAYAFISWRLFKKKGYNYAENFVLHVAIQSQISTWSFLIILPMAYFLGAQATIPLTVAGFLFLFTSFTVANRQFFKVSWGQAVFKGILIYMLSYIIQVILIAIVIVVLITTKSF